MVRGYVWITFSGSDAIWNIHPHTVLNRVEIQCNIMNILPPTFHPFIHGLLFLCTTSFGLYYQTPERPLTVIKHYQSHITDGLLYRRCCSHFPIQIPINVIMFWLCPLASNKNNNASSIVSTFTRIQSPIKLCTYDQ